MSPWTLDVRFTPCLSDMPLAWLWAQFRRTEQNRRINAAIGTRIKEHGVKQLKFRSRDGQRQDWQMLVTDVKKALKSVATTCDGNSGDECHMSCSLDMAAPASMSTR